MPFGLQGAFLYSEMPQKTITPNVEREHLILEHMAQVRLIARRIYEKLPGNVSFDDLVSAGTVGLITAIDRFDPTQGVKLKTYAEYKIRGAILDSLRTADWAPRLQRKRARLIQSAVGNLEQRLQRAPKEEEVAAELGISVQEYQHWSSDAHALTMTSLDSATSNEDGRDLLQFVADEDQILPSEMLERSELGKLVGRALERMPQSERTVLNLYYQREMTLREIARIMDLHESRISQLKTQGVARLRTFLANRWPERGQVTLAKVA
jgi:RNA polymerase sigma factor for flagellar operon FliA